MIRIPSPESGEERKQVNWRALSHGKESYDPGMERLGLGVEDYFVSYNSNCGFLVKGNGKPLKDFIQGKT